MKILTESLFSIGDVPVTMMGIFRVIIIIIFSIILSRGIQKTLNNLSEKDLGISSSVLYIFGRLTHYAVVSLGIMIGFASIGLDFSSVAIVAGALSVGIGFGLQSIFNNFVSGLILLFERPLKVDDFVELESGVRGEVKEINVRSTRITTKDNIDILVPNSEFINGRVINLTLDDNYRRVHIPFGVSYQSDKNLVKKAALEAANNLDYTVKNKKKFAPDVWLVKFGESSLDFELVVWVNHKFARMDRIDVRYLWELETSFQKYEINIPFPQRDIHLKSGPQIVLNSKT